MREIVRTIIYGIVAVLFVAATWWVSRLTAPETPREYTLVGKPFYEPFDPEKAAHLELIAIPEGETKPTKFEIGFSDGMWRILSHHGYPAEAEDRLARTAASVIGVTRLSLAGRRKSQHAGFGVIDPLSEELEDPSAAGKRIRLLDRENNPLSDLIIGKRVEENREEFTDENNENPEEAKKAAIRKKPLYYVRRPDEEETYLARIDLNISTRFSDWIEPDLLKLKAGDVRQIVIDNYRVAVRLVPLPGGAQLPRAVRDQREVLKLSRDESWQPWKLDGLNSETESLKTEKIDDLLSVLDEMTILGVAPRYKEEGQTLLTADLRFRPPPSARNIPEAVALFRRLARDLDDKGFALQFDPENLRRDRFEALLKNEGAIPAELLSENGDLTVVTAEGIVYHLHFGAVAEGTEKEIQIGGRPRPRKTNRKKKENSAPQKTRKTEAGQSPPGKNAKKASAKKEPKTADEDASRSEDNSSADLVRRYVLIRVEFDEREYRDKPKKPVKPAAPRRPVLSAVKPRNVRPPVVAARPHRQGERPAVAAQRPNPVARFRTDLTEYRRKLRTYELDLQTYKEDQKKYEENVEKVKARVERLNQRFADWYYVVSTRHLKRLSLSRNDLIGPKKEEKPAAGPAKPLPFGRFPPR